MRKLVTLVMIVILVIAHVNIEVRSAVDFTSFGGKTFTLNIGCPNSQHQSWYRFVFDL